jgi:NADPH2:quinone reductase
MKAVRAERTGGPEVLIHQDVDDPSPGPGEALIRVRAASVNFADIMRRRGDRHPSPTSFPFVPGAEVAGTVAAVGDGVTGLEVGAPVFALVGENGSSGYAQYALADAAQVIPLPPGLEPAKAAALVVAGATAFLALNDAGRLAPGETVLIQAAAGGVGGYAVQLAKLLGAGKVIALASTEGKRAEAVRLGADHVVDYTALGWAERVRELTGGRGADLVLEMSGGTVFGESLRALAPFGRSVVYGYASGENVALDPQDLLTSSQAVIGFNLGAWFQHEPEQAFGALQRLIGFVLSGEVEVQVGRVLPLARAADAHRALEARETTGKIILDPWLDADAV